MKSYTDDDLAGEILMTPCETSALEPNSFDPLENDLGIRRIGYLLAVLLIFGIGFWATFAPIEGAALAPGVVQVAGKRKPVQHLEGGIVREILVNNGDLVKEGQVLLRLDSTLDLAELEIAQGRLINLEARVTRLRSERSGTKQIDFSAMQAEGSQTDARIQAAIENERSLFDARLAAMTGEESVLAAQRQGQEMIGRSKAAIVSSLEQEIADLSELLEDGYVDKQRLRDLERQKTAAEGELADVRISIEELRLRSLQLVKDFRTEVVDELTRSLEQLYDVRQKYKALNDRVERRSVRAPASGIVLDRQPNSIGYVVKPGETLMELVPQIEDLIVEARIAPMDIDRVRVGQPAEIRFSVFKDAYLISGRLAQLSADRIIDAETDTPYYQAEVRIIEDDLFLLNGMTLMPGMPAEVLVKTGDRTMLGYLTSPLNRLFSQALLED